MKQRVLTIVIAIGVVIVLAVMVIGSTGSGAGTGASRQSAVRGATGLESGGIVTSIEWGDPVVVTVPDSWMELKPTAREGYLHAIWEAGPDKADVQVVDERGDHVQAYSPPPGPQR